jgi:2,3,4,5-tetrahydropyridine-2-carboxylate N-succinyltransferase
MMQQELESLYTAAPAQYSAADQELFARFKAALNAGEIRAAEPDASAPTGWRVNPWVKQGILIGFRMGTLTDMSVDPRKQPFFDKWTYPVRHLETSSGVRLVPGGSSIRDGCYLGKGVTCMPPMYINVGAWVDDGTMVDSHALVGSCAQVGKRCHISAAAQIGGVLEPVGALPVIIEDDVLLGGNTGVYEGTVVKRRAVLGTGVILNRSTPLYDLVRGEVYTASDDSPLVVPEGAVVVAGSRAVSRGKGAEWGISLYTPVIVKYRDERTEVKVRLEDYLR